MALFNYATRELSAKIVYYGPGLSGKTTNIEKVHELLKPGQKGKLISLPTETDRTLFFDFLPVQLGRIKGFNVRFHLYTVPGQVFYNATRRLVLQGVDGVVFVADSQEGMKESNLESLRNLEENLATYGKKLDELPFLIQLNKRDLKKVQSAEEMNASLNRLKVPTTEASALTGQGVIETLSAISRLVFQHLRKSLLLPGESAADEMEERIGETFGAAPGAAPGTAPAEPPSAGVEELEEIAEIEELQEAAPPPPPPDTSLSRFGEAIPFPAEEEGVPDEVELPGGGEEAPVAAASAEVPDEVELPGAGGEEFSFEELERIDVELPTPASLAPPSPGLAASPEVPAAGAAEEETVSAADLLGGGAEWSPLGEDSSFTAPPPAPPPAAPTPAPSLVPSVAVETEEGASLTFLRFEAPEVGRDGAALLPMVLLDGDGNTVRLRLRITMEVR